MIYVYGFEAHTLEAMNPQTTQCAEDFLADIEQQLEDGDITEDEAITLIRDFASRT